MARVPVPYRVRRRAWERGYVLRHDYNGRLSPSQFRLAWITHTDAVTWTRAVRVWWLWWWTVERRR